MTHRIYLTDLPENSQLYKGAKQFNDESQEAFEGWTKFAGKHFGDKARFLAGYTFRAIVLPANEPLPDGWRFTKDGPHTIVPRALGDKDAYKEFKHLKRRPDGWRLTVLCGANIIHEGNTAYFLTLVLDANDKFIISLPVSREGVHHPIPEGARELTWTEYNEALKDGE